MDATDVFHQGFGTFPPRQQRQQQQQQLLPSGPQSSRPRKHQHGHQRGDDDSETSSHRIAHTLTACSRCRQRKTRCDPTLPRCLPCERSNSVCEYFDTTKGKKISRSYVVKLQEKVRHLESELAQFTEDTEFPRNLGDIVRPGGLVRLDERDETPRYLGPSSGIAMTRLLMEEAKRYTQANKISELIPDEFKARRAERANRMQSIVGLGGSISGPSARRKSYPKLSAGPQLQLPTKAVLDKLVEAFNTRAQVFTPVLHEQVFAKDLEEVCNGSTDPYKTFIVRMFLAISLQKLDIQYAGLADGYWQAAMQGFETVVRPKDLKTLQCLVLIGEYSLLTPTRTNVYHIIGLATRICQQLGLADEKTIASGFSVDPLTLDMRRRLSWIVMMMELGLAHSMGRPCGFAKGDDFMDVDFFADVDDSLITEQGIQQGPPSEKKLVAIHFCKMRICQAEIRRTLYEKERHEPRDENDPWFVQMEQKIEAWLKAVPEEPQWCKPWFTGQYHTMLVFLNRPNPQIPRPTARAAETCFDSSQYIINLSSQQIKQAAVDTTWVFLLTLYMSLNTILWAVSYPEVRDAHPKKDVEELVNAALDIIDQCAERWPGSSSAAELYSAFAKACMQSYDISETPPSVLDNNYAATPLTMASSDSPTPPEPNTMGMNPPSSNAAPLFNQGPFGGYDFSAPPQAMGNPFGGFNDPFQGNAGGPSHPQFRSNSIFMDPASSEPSGSGRRMSYYPPEATPPGDDTIPEEATPPATTTPQAHQASPPIGGGPPPRDAMSTPGPTTSTTSLSPPIAMSASGSSPTPTMSHASPLPFGSASPNLVGIGAFDANNPAANTAAATRPQPRPQQVQQPAQSQRGGGVPGAFTIPALPSQQTWPGAPAPQHHHHHQQQQRPLPQATTVTDWFNPPPPFISPYAAFSGLGGGQQQQQQQQQQGVSAAHNPFADPSSTVFSGIGFGSGSPSAFAGMGGLGSGMGMGMGAGPGGSGQGGFGMNGMLGGGGAANEFDGLDGFAAGRQGSLSQEQQMELMGMLETDGLGEIDTFLNFGGGALGMGGQVGGGLRW